MAVLRHNKYEKRWSFSFDFIAFSPRCLGLPPCHEDEWKEWWYCFFIAIKVFLHHRVVVEKHLCWAMQKMALPSSPDFKCATVSRHTAFLCFSINRRQFIATSIFPRFCRKGLAVPSSSNRRSRALQKRLRSYQTNTLFMKNSWEIGSAGSSVKRNARPYANEHTRKEVMLRKKLLWLVRTTLGWVSRIEQRITGNVLRFSYGRIIKNVLFSRGDLSQYFKDLF